MLSRRTNINFLFNLMQDIWYSDLHNVIYIHSEVRIEGLETLDYLDNLCQRERFTEQGDAITFESEVSILLITTV